MTIENVFEAIWGTVALSATATVKLKVPDAVGVPMIVPSVDSVSPPGKAPVGTVQLYGERPPDTVSA